MASPDQDARKDAGGEKDEIFDTPIKDFDADIEELDELDLELEIDVDFDMDEGEDFALEDANDSIIEMVDDASGSAIELVDDDDLAIDDLADELLDIEYESSLSSVDAVRPPPHPSSSSSTGEHMVIGRVAVGPSSVAVSGEDLKEAQRRTQEQEGVILVLEAQLEQANKSISDLQGRVGNTIDESLLMSKERRIASLEIELKDAVAVAMEAKASFQAGQDADALRFRLETLEPALEMARQKNEALRSENTRMKRSVDRAAGEVSLASSAALEAKKSQSAAEGQLNIKDNLLVQKGQDLQTAEQRVSELTRELEAARVDAVEAQEVRDKSQESFLVLQQTFDAKSERFAETVETLAETRGALVAAEAAREEAQLGHEQSRLGFEEKIQSLEEDVALMELAKEEEAAERAKDAKTIEDLEFEVLEVKERSAKAEVEAAELSKKVGEVGLSLAEILEARDALKAELEMQRGEAEEGARAFEAQTETLAAQKEALRAEAARVKSEFAEFEALAHEELEGMESERSQLAERVSALNAEKEQQRDSLAILLTAHGASEEDGDERDLFKELDGLFAGFSEERDALAEQVESANTEVERLKKALDDGPEWDDVEALKSEGQTFREEVEALKAELQGSKTELEEALAKSDTTQLRAEHQELAEAYETLQEAHFDRSKELMSALTDAERMRANVVKIAEELAAVREEADNLARHNQEIEARNEDLAKRSQAFDENDADIDDSAREGDSEEALQSEDVSPGGSDTLFEAADAEFDFEGEGALDSGDEVDEPVVEEDFSDLEIDAGELAFGEDDAIEDVDEFDGDLMGLEDDFNPDVEVAAGRPEQKTIVDRPLNEVEEDQDKINLDDLDFGEDDFEAEEDDFFEEVFELDEEVEVSDEPGGEEAFPADADAERDESDFFDDEVYEDLESLDDEVHANHQEEEQEDHFSQLESQGMLNLRPSADFEMAKGIDSKAGYLLSQADGETSIQEIIELSPLDVTDSAKLVVQLIELGAMRV
jgi:chromosome segregation ATPase